jgi:CheY-like chemotaxis protein
MKILYVEDNALVREVTAELLFQEGREIVSCETAEEALNAFTAAGYDLVITDVSLPVMSGLDLTRRLLREKPGLPVILASGYGLQSAIDGMGPNVRSIVKPFDADAIDTLIQQLTHPRV